METSKILVVDDHPFFLHGLHKYLADTGRYDVQSALSIREALIIFDAYLPDLVIMDVSMADGGGLAMLRQVKERAIVRTMFLTVQIDPEDTIKALKLGIDGIALKDRDPDEIVEIIDCVLAGGTSIDSSVTEGALRHSVKPPPPALRQDDLLTPREAIIVDLVCRGMRNREIAANINLAEGTVKVHLHNVYRKLGVSSRSELIVKKGGLQRSA
jgi:two-component system nitrate/nitrite response regulator NarP